MTVEIKPVLNKGDVRHFIRMQRDLLRENLAFVPPREAPLVHLLDPDSCQSVPLTDRTFMPFFSRDACCFVRDKKGDVVGFAHTVPSLAKALRKADGRIFPFGWWHLRQAFRRNETIELLIIGVLQEYQSKGVPAVLFRELWQNIINRGFQRAIANPELTDNHWILNSWQGYEKRQVTTRKTFIKPL